MSTHKAARAFNDAGTGKSFAAGGTVEGDAGQIENYKAAGLLEPETKAKADSKADAKPA